MQEPGRQAVLLKKYLLKRQRVREEPSPEHASIFRTAPPDEPEPPSDRDPFKKYQTLSTGGDNSSTLELSRGPSFLRPLLSDRGATSNLPSLLPMQSALGQQGLSASRTLETTPVAPRAKCRELARHASDPFHVRLEKTNVRRVQRKHGLYQKRWISLAERREPNSLLRRSFEKAAGNLEAINVDAERRRNFPRFEDMLRNSIAEKTFSRPALLKL
jgi:hypothetical protein